MTTPLRTLLAIVESRTGWPYLAAAVRNALRRRPVRRRRVLEVPVSPLAYDRLATAIDAAEEEAGG